MTAQTFRMDMPASISVRRDTPDGAEISPWIYSAYVPWADCTTHDSSAGVGYEPPPGLSPTPLMVYGQVIGYTVFQTNVPGIGVAFAGTTGIDGGYWLINPGSRAFPWPWAGKTSHNGSYALQGRLSAVLVKTGPVAAGTVSLPSMRAGVGEESNLLPIYKTFTFSDIQIVPPSCLVSGASVELGDVATAGFRGVGTATGGRNFTLKLDGCPAGFRSIDIQFHPANGAVAGYEDVSKLNGGNTAQGVGVKLQWADGSTLRWDSKLKVPGYTGQAADIQLKMNAAYYQIAPVIQPGTADASFEVTLFYE
jgi:major type 1 subunit fimbrin (pilin)